LIRVIEENGKSTVTTHLVITHDWFQMLDSVRQKAFDIIPHNAFMQHTGLNNHILHWVCSYLTKGVDKRLGGGV